MSATLTIDKAGRVIIPKAVRDELHLEAGDTLELESEGEKVTLRPVRSRVPLQKERGVWVYRTGKTLPASVADATLRAVREDRDRHNQGETASVSDFRS